MDDVLPKPFTRKGLLDMLERHLVHLKTMPQGMDAPQPAAAVTMAQSSAAPSVKEDSSPGQSPAASMSNWQSPGQFQGMPTVHPTIPQVQGQYVPATPAAPTAYAVDQNGVQYPAAPPVALAATTPTAARPPHRRQISEMSSAPDNSNMAKRPRMYAQPTPAMVNSVQATRTG